MKKSQQQFQQEQTESPFKLFNDVYKKHMAKGCNTCDNVPPFPIWWECSVFNAEMKAAEEELCRKV